MPRSPARPPTSAPAPTRSWRRSRPTCSGCRSTTSRIKLGDSTLPQSPVEGGSWIAASVSNGIATTADDGPRGTAAPGARQMPNSPLADATPDDVALADGKLVSRRDASRAVSIADVMRHGGVDRIEQEKPTTFDDERLARAQHALGDLRRGEGRRAARRHPRHARRQRGRGRPHPEHQDRAAARSWAAWSGASAWRCTRRR